METPVFVSTEIQNADMLLLGKNPDGTIRVTFELDTLWPKRIYNYQPWYIDRYYKFSHIMRWSNEN